MFMGKRRVGFLSGSPYEATVADKRDEPNPRIKRGRIIFGVFGMIFITFTFLLVFLGLANLEETTRSMADGSAVSQVNGFRSDRWFVVTLVPADNAFSSSPNFLDCRRNFY